MRWVLPNPRHNKDECEYRVGFVLENPLVPVCSGTKSVLEHAVRVCERAGVRLKEGWPPDVDFGAVLDCYYFHLGAFDYSMTRPEFQVHTRDHLDTKPRTWNVGP